MGKIGFMKNSFNFQFEKRVFKLMWKSLEKWKTTFGSSQNLFIVF